MEERPWFRHYDPGVPRRLEVPEKVCHEFLEARAAGMPVAMLTTSHSRAELEREQPASIWADFLDHQPLELPWLPTSS